MRLILFLVLFIPTATLASVNPVPPAAGNIHLGADETFFSSDGNFSAGGGGFSNLGNGGQFQEFTTQLLGDYDFNSKFRLRSHFSMSGIQAKNSIYSHTNFHMDKVGLGGESWWAFGRVPVILHGDVSAPLHKPNLDSIDETFGTNGAMEANAGIFARPRFFGFLGKVGVGYLWRGENLSHLLPWTVGATYVLSVGQIGGGFRGFQTVVKDSSSETDRAKRNTAIQNNQAGSLAYLSTNPDLQQLYVDSRWGITKGLDFLTDASYDINGTNYAKGFSLSVGLRWILNFSGAMSASSDFSSDQKGFHIKNENYEHNLFQQADPSYQPPPPVRKKPQKSLNQLMNETEESLEP